MLNALEQLQNSHLGDITLKRILWNEFKAVLYSIEAMLDAPKQLQRAPSWWSDLKTREIWNTNDMVITLTIKWLECINNNLAAFCSNKCAEATSKLFFCSHLAYVTLSRAKFEMQTNMATHNVIFLTAKQLSVFNNFSIIPFFSSQTACGFKAILVKATDWFNYQLKRIVWLFIIMLCMWNI